MEFLGAGYLHTNLRIALQESLLRKPMHADLDLECMTWEMTMTVTIRKKWRSPRILMKKATIGRAW